MEAYLEKIGEFGKYQRQMFLMLSLPTVIVSMQKLAWVFLGAMVDHRCLLPGELDNATFILDDSIKNSSIPWDTDRDPHGYSQCKMYSGVNIDDLEQPNKTGAIECNHWVYDRSEYQTSAVIDFDLVCSRNWLKATVQSVYMVGMLVGSYLFGDLSDRFGRKPIFLSSLVLMVVMGVAQAAIPEYITFTIARFVLGASLQGVFLVAYVMAMELVGKKYRVLVGVLAQAFYSIGYFTAAMLAYLIPDWRILQITMTLPALLFIPYYWIVPESSRWLIAKKRGQEAKVNLIKAAKVNKKEVSDEILEQAVELPSKESIDSNFLDLFRTPNLRKKTINLFFNWFVNSGVYYGLSLNTGNLGGNAYLNFVISGAVELPAHALTIFLLDRVGRRLPLCIYMILGGIALLCTMFVPKDMTWLIITLSMFGKFCITASYAVIYVFTAEIFPTVVRNVGVGSSSMVARIGGALAPYVNILGLKWRPLPLLIFGSLSCTAGILALLLPETLNRKLPESIEEAENFERKPSELEVAAFNGTSEQLKSLTENEANDNADNNKV